MRAGAGAFDRGDVAERSPCRSVLADAIEMGDDLVRETILEQAGTSAMASPPSSAC